MEIGEKMMKRAADIATSILTASMAGALFRYALADASLEESMRTGALAAAAASTAWTLAAFKSAAKFNLYRISGRPFAMQYAIRSLMRPRTANHALVVDAELFYVNGQQITADTVRQFLRMQLWRRASFRANVHGVRNVDSAWRLSTALCIAVNLECVKCGSSPFLITQNNRIVSLLVQWPVAYDIICASLYAPRPYRDGIYFSAPRPPSVAKFRRQIGRRQVAT
jgi:hypothetical protein